MKLRLFAVISGLLLIMAIVVSVRYYSYVFARHVKGEVVGIDRVTQPSAVFSTGGPIPASQVFSFALAIRESSGEIVTSSTEDRQWAVVEKGQCVEAKFFPYPPWELDKAGTYSRARLLHLYDCPKN